MHRLQLGHRRERPGAPDRDRDPVQHGLRLLGRELVSDGPARRPPGGAEALPPVDAVDLEDHAVDLEVHPRPLVLDLAIEGHGIVEARTSPGGLRQLEAPCVKALGDVALKADQPLAHIAISVGEEAQPSLLRERRVELAQAAGGGVAGIDERLFACRFPFPVQRCKVLEPDIDLAPDLQPLRHVRALQHMRQVAHSAQVLGHVLAGLAVAARGAEDEPAVLVTHGRREAVDLGCAVERHGLILGEIEEAAHAAQKLGELVVVERVGERQHGRVVADLGEARRGRRAHALAGAVGALEIGEARLDGLVAPAQRVVVGIEQFGIGVLVVEPVVAGDLARQALKLACRGVGGQVFRGRGLVAHGALRASRLPAAARASSVTRAPESMRAISSRRCASSSSATRAAAAAPRSPSPLATR